MISLYDIGIAYDKAEFIDLYEEGNEDLKAFIAENELPDYYYIYKNYRARIYNTPVLRPFCAVLHPSTFFEKGTNGIKKGLSEG